MISLNHLITAISIKVAAGAQKKEFIKFCWRKSDKIAPVIPEIGFPASGKPVNFSLEKLVQYGNILFLNSSRIVSVSLSFTGNSETASNKVLS